MKIKELKSLLDQFNEELEVNLVVTCPYCCGHFGEDDHCYCSDKEYTFDISGISNYLNKKKQIIGVSILN